MDDVPRAFGIPATSKLQPIRCASPYKSSLRRNKNETKNKSMSKIKNKKKSFPHPPARKSPSKTLPRPPFRQLDGRWGAAQAGVLK